MSEVTVHGAWRKNNARYEEDAVALWAKLGAIPERDNAQARSKELMVVAYRGDELLGLTTAFIEFYPPLRANFAFNRILIDPSHQGEGLLEPLMHGAFDEIESWAKQNPEAALGGFAGVRQQTTDDPRLRRPKNEASGTTLIGFTGDGNQVRVRWFPHYRPG